jgi:RimJ/RimL family protein N-acetyltransferase
MILDTPLLTERLRLRSLTSAACGQRYLGWMRDEAVQRFLESRGQPMSLESLAAFVAKANVDPDTLMLGMFQADDDQHIGNIKLGPIDRRHARASLGILIGERDAWGRGYATEAVRAVSDYAIAKLGVAKVTAGAYDENAGSIAAFQRAGFVIEGRLARHAVLDGRRVDVVMMAKHA